MEGNDTTMGDFAISISQWDSLLNRGYIVLQKVAIDIEKHDSELFYTFYYTVYSNVIYNRYGYHNTGVHPMSDFFLSLLPIDYHLLSLQSISLLHISELEKIDSKKKGVGWNLLKCAQSGLFSY